VDEVTALFAPSTTTVQAVKSWLINSGIQNERISQSTNKIWLQFDASIQEMETLLQTKYTYYEHVTGGRKHIGCEEYNVPLELTGHIEYVVPGVKALATREMGEKMKRDLVELQSERGVGKKMPPDALVKTRRAPSTYPSILTQLDIIY
jgi:tripeptidyl-peptidase I